MSFVIKNLIEKILDLPRPFKTFIGISNDFASCVVSVWLSYYLRLGDIAPLSERGFIALFFAVLISFPIFYLFGFYKSIFRYSGLYALVIVSRAIFIYGVFYSLLVSFIGLNGVPRTIGLIQPLLFLVFISSWRVVLRLLLRNVENNKFNKKIVNTFVYGAGNAGRQVLSAMRESSEILIKGFLDDDSKQHGCFIDGKPIHSPKRLKELIDRKNISLVLLALPSVSGKRRKEIIAYLSKYKISVRSIPGIADLATGKSLITDFVDLDMYDLLGRIEVKPSDSLMKKNISSKTIMVTGSGGSIGSELCRQIIKLRPKKIILVEISEYALYQVHSELEQINNSSTKLIPLIGSVQDIWRMDQILSLWRPNTIYHAAAYKHVPIVEHNLIEGLKNNAIGTFQLAKLAVKYNISNFVFISTDKAVRPTNFMGATKRLAEICLQAMHQKLNNQKDKVCKTKFSIVRFGNVLDSSGSVIPKFRDQIREGGPITLTHKEITRYFMTIPEAAQLVIQAGALASGGDVFVLDMGEPIRIYDLAVKIIQLSGLSVRNHSNEKGDIEIIVTGLRPGEKLYEELLLSNNPIMTKHPKIFRSKEPFMQFEKLENEIKILVNLLEKNEVENILIKLKEIVIDYSPSEEIVDHTFVKKV